MKIIRDSSILYGTENVVIFSEDSSFDDIKTFKDLSNINMKLSIVKDPEALDKIVKQVDEDAEPTLFFTTAEDSQNIIAEVSFIKLNKFNGILLGIF